MKSIFEKSQDIDFHKKFHESMDKRSIKMYCLAGRDILVATLKKESQFKTIQEALASEYERMGKEQEA